MSASEAVKENLLSHVQILFAGMFYHFPTFLAFCGLLSCVAGSRPDTEQSITRVDRDATMQFPPSGTEMVFIPAGEFEMGSQDGAPDEQPVHTVRLSAFYIDKYEVTVGQYRQFVHATGAVFPDWTEVARYAESNEHPMVNVSWYDAMAYARWAGKTLPTEAQWEYAARGGLEGKVYPWGNKALDVTKANYEDSKIEKTVQVGSYPGNGYGLHDMAGNVWEWCIDEYLADFYETSPGNNPVAGPQISLLDDGFRKVATRRVVRGGGWDAAARRLRVAYRDGNGPRGKVDSVGFRCVRPIKSTVNKKPR
ncbi:MAG: formylglycine-generating enzyme family protein [Candidatus Poribacteria bacterium]|nr:formylglycine-generating enzyme family protein [Candidatus Poribacteria bacterium]MDE0506802.1 formylglycine-generating enzyme family protein [Candidatus Poribacteria bacterium]